MDWCLDKAPFFVKTVHKIIKQKHLGEVTGY